MNKNLLSYFVLSDFIPPALKNTVGFAAVCGVAVLTLGLSACGIEGTGGPGPIVNGGAEDDAPIASRRVIAAGPIDGISSVIVNGVRYATDEAEINISGAAGLEDALALGQVVLVSGTINADNATGTAEQVDFIPNLRGPVASINALTNTLIVLDQVIALSNETQLGAGIEFDNLDQLPLDTLVEVSGLPTASGAVIATRIDIIESGTDVFSITGTLENLNELDLQFNINNLIVDYSNADITGDTTQLSNDQHVFIDGVLTNDILVASSIRIATLIPPLTPDLQVDIEALISSFNSITDFELAGVSITTTDETTFIGGTINDLKLNSSINVKGAINDDNVLVATQIEFIPISLDFLVTANVQAVQVNVNNSFDGSLHVLGLELLVSGDTVYRDLSGLGTSFVGLADVQLADKLDIRAIFDGDNIITTRITRLDDTDDRIRLRSTVNTVSSSLLIIHGITTTFDARIVFVDIDGREIDEATFMQQVSEQSVLVEGEYIDQSILADRIQLIANADVNIGTDSRDTLIGTEEADQIFGGDDADFIIGGGGNDELHGENGNDTIYNDAGDDMVFGGAGNDILFGGSGADMIDGGTGSSDLVDYIDSPAAVNVTLGLTGMGGFAEGDTLLNVENLRGSIFNDVLSGDALENTINGDMGDDEIFGLDGADTLRGDQGNDRLHGGNGQDRIEGGEGEDELFGNAGNDFLASGPGADLIDGGAGNDFALYTQSPVGIRIALDGMPGTGGYAEGDVLVNIENIRGGRFQDVLTGDDSDNILQAGDGVDQLFGLGGQDQLEGGQGNDLMHGGDDDDIVHGGDGNDFITGGNGDDIVYPGRNRDNASGGSHILGDTVSYRFSASGVQISLDGSAGTGGEADQDTVFGFEILEGSSFNDVLLGDELANTLLGHEGNDILAGRQGNDILRGHVGSDTYLFDPGGGVDVVDEALVEFTDSVDILRFGFGIDERSLWFSEDNGDLLIFVIGSSDSVRVSQWFANDVHVERIEVVANGNDSMVLLSSDVFALVVAMGFVEPVLEGEVFTVTDAEFNQVVNEINTRWSPL